MPKLSTSALEIIRKAQRTSQGGGPLIRHIDVGSSSQASGSSKPIVQDSPIIVKKTGQRQP